MKTEMDNRDEANLVIVIFFFCKQARFRQKIGRCRTYM